MADIIVKADINELTEVQSFIQKEIASAGATKSAINQVLLAAEEIFVNICNYAYENAGEAEISVEKNETAVVVTFSDGGVPYNPLSAADPDITLPADKRKIGGLGIFMTRKLTDGVEYEHKDGKNILRIYKKV
jgi:anti-sigma regulatory factor (Ser/Thr protein kinase)